MFHGTKLIISYNVSIPRGMNNEHTQYWYV